MTQRTGSAGHVALVGDSIFDNAAYTRGEPDVVGHLRTLLPRTWQASLLAVDGAMVDDVPRQLVGLPQSVTHVVMSAGGNNALRNSDLLDMPSRTSADTLQLFAQRLQPFEAAYRRVLGMVAATGCRTTVCTIYNGALEPEQATRARVALMTFNDIILRAAFEHGVDVIDLRLICTDTADYANPIEPSGTGGLKIAKVVTRAIGIATPGVTAHVFQ
jgi:GDSL-like Lipase/Acylhydrolase family